MINVKILGCGAELGRHEVATADLLRTAKIGRFGFSDEFVAENMGITHVRQADIETLPSDLALPAAERAIRQSGLSAMDIDMVIFCGITAEWEEPAVAHKIAAALDIRADHVFDTKNACHGFTTGVQIAQAYISTGMANCALICTGEVNSAATNMVSRDLLKGRFVNDKVDDCIGAFTVGDAGGAMVIGRSSNGSGIKYSKTLSNSKLAKLCFHDSWGKNLGGESTYAMKMGKICAATISVVRKMVPVALNDIGWSPEDIDHSIYHQVGTRVYDTYTKIMGIDPGSALATYPKYGNLASATIPVCWNALRESDSLKEGQNVFAISTGSGIVVSMLGIVA